jgi:hypothetical protein
MSSTNLSCRTSSSCTPSSYSGRTVSTLSSTFLVPSSSSCTSMHIRHPQPRLCPHTPPRLSLRTPPCTPSAAAQWRHATSLPSSSSQPDPVCLRDSSPRRLSPGPWASRRAATASWTRYTAPRAKAAYGRRTNSATSTPQCLRCISDTLCSSA